MRGMELLRRPLFWMIAAEVVVVTILLVAAWHFFDSYRHGMSAAPAGLARAPGRSVPGPASSPKVSASSPASPGNPVPSAAPTRVTGLPFDIKALNSDAAGWERQQERLAALLTRALRAYVETVVVPAVERAERVSPATSPATTQSPAAIRNTP